MKLLEPLRLLYRYRNMIKQTSFNDIKARYAGSLLGLAWAALYPILFLGCYAMVYIYVFNVRFQMFNTNEYVILIFCGLIPFLGFQETINSGITSVVANVGLMKNTLFPIELVPVKSLIVSQTTQFSGLVIIFVALGFLGKLTFLSPLVLLFWVLQMAFQLGLSWILSSLNVLFRDLQNIVALLTLLLMFISPIAYPVSMVPPNLVPFLKMNPLFYIISCYQDVLIYGRLPQLAIFLPFLTMSLFSFVGGYWFFMKMKRVFVDNV
ncbi:ABC transporter permease [Desulfosporosinus fructosivorans]